jgi:hypothetical protein
MRQFIVNIWNFIFNAEVSPLRHIQDVAIRHYVFQALGFMWAVSFAVAIGSYTILAASIIGHTCFDRGRSDYGRNLYRCCDEA